MIVETTAVGHAADLDIVQGAYNCIERAQSREVVNLARVNGPGHEVVISRR